MEQEFRLTNVNFKLNFLFDDFLKKIVMLSLTIRYFQIIGQVYNC